MAEPTGAVLPILQKITKDLSEFRKSADTKFTSLDAKMNDLSEHVLDIKSDISEIRKDNVIHPGLTSNLKYLRDA